MTSTQETTSSPEVMQDSLKKSWLRPSTEEEMQAYWDKLRPGGERLREALSSVPYWAEGARKAREAGREDKYWMSLFSYEVNLHRPPKKSESSTVAKQVV